MPHPWLSDQGHWARHAPTDRTFTGKAGQREPHMTLDRYVLQFAAKDPSEPRAQTRVSTRDHRRGERQVRPFDQVGAPAGVGESIDMDVEDALRKLTPLEQRVLRLRFGIGRGTQEVENGGRQFGVRRPQLRQIEARALRKLRQTALQGLS